MRVEIDGMIIEFDKQEFLWQGYKRYIQKNLEKLSKKQNIQNVPRIKYPRR